MSTDYGLCPEYGRIDYRKTPDEAVTIEFPWAQRLEAETISSRSFELPDGLTSENEATSGTITSIRVSGGTDGKNYRVIAKITTSGDNDYEIVKRVSVREG